MSLDEATRRDIAKNESYRDQMLTQIQEESGRRFKVEVDFVAFANATKSNKVGSMLFGYILEAVAEAVLRICRDPKLKVAFFNLTEVAIIRYVVGKNGGPDGSCKQPVFTDGALIITIAPDSFHEAHNYVCSNLEASILAAEVKLPASGSGGSSPSAAATATKSAVADISPSRRLYVALNLHDDMSAVDVELLRSLVTTPGFPIDTVVDEKTGNTALHIVSRARRIPLVRLLLDAGADVNCRNADGDTPLHAVVMSAAGLTQHWHKEGAEIIHVLVKDSKGRLDPNARNKSGSTALHLAILFHVWEHVFTLLKDCPNNLDLSLKDDAGRTLLNVAVEQGNEEVIKMIENYRMPAGGAKQLMSTSSSAGQQHQELSEIVTLLTTLADFTAAETQNGGMQAHLRQLSYDLKKKYGLC